MLRNFSLAYVNSLCLRSDLWHRGWFHQPGKPSARTEWNCADVVFFKYGHRISGSLTVDKSGLSCCMARGIGPLSVEFFWFGGGRRTDLVVQPTDSRFFVFLLAVPIAVVLLPALPLPILTDMNKPKHISEQLDRLCLQTIEAMASAVVDAKDPYTHGHIRRVQVYAVALARLSGITDQNDLMAIRAGALLHDIGKIAIPEYILNKPTVLTDTEFEKMKIHPIVGANMVKRIEFPYAVEPLVKSHHERWDGKGYPEGIKGEDIPLGARILSLVDCYDALTTNRPYRVPMSRIQLVEFFQRESGHA